MNKPNIVLYGNGSAGNHGCEAIVRGTWTLLHDHANALSILSENPEEDFFYGLGQMASISPAKGARKQDWRFLLAYAKLKTSGDYTDLDGLYYLPYIQALKDRDGIALSVGGDNYCYGGTSLYAYLNKAYQKNGMKTVLWGCSIEPDVVMQPQVARDLSSYHLVVPRESITFEAVKQVQPNTILAPDPAFYMEPVACPVDKRLEHVPVIGVNISPMILSNEASSGMAYENYKRLVAHILDSTDAAVALIPHVVWPSNDDRTVLRRLYEEFGQSERLVLVEDHTAPDLKYIISKCDFFVGSRTHATIAAYSTCVPTLVVGYSVKARGIARDLFGAEEGYVLPVQELNRPDQLTEAFDRLYRSRGAIRTHLEQFIPVYKETHCAVSALNQLR